MQLVCVASCVAMAAPTSCEWHERQVQCAQAKKKANRGRWIKEERKPPQKNLVYPLSTHQPVFSLNTDAPLALSRLGLASRRVCMSGTSLHDGTRRGVRVGKPIFLVSNIGARGRSDLSACLPYMQSIRFLER
uniref:Putative secreted protein n=1 Tax=Anopheles darlingi TaxID=43151 RepID=A0A2M4DG61_ANODA